MWQPCLKQSFEHSSTWKVRKYDENKIIGDQCECELSININAADESDHTWCSVSLFVHITTSDVISHSLSSDVEYIYIIYLYYWLFIIYYFLFILLFAFILIISHSLSGDVDYIYDDDGDAIIYSLFEHEIHITLKFWEKLLVIS